MNLETFGFKHYQSLTKKVAEQDIIARVLAEHKTNWDLITSSKETKGIILEGYRKKHKDSEMPKVGDFVKFETINGESKVKIIKILPRFSALGRTKGRDKQILATNVDVLCIVVGLDQELNPNQIQRFASLGIEGGMQVVIVLNKTDKVKAAATIKKQIQKSLPDIEIIETSAKIGTGLNALSNHIKKERTAIFVGASGAGKSSLLNSLLNQNQQAVSSTRGDGRGRHTTTHREMFLLPNGGIVIDTPGIRTLEQDTSEETASIILSDIAALTQKCKFRNCDHIKSAGCAVIKALDGGKMDPKQYKQFLKLINASEFENSKEDIDIQIQRRHKRKAQTKLYKKHFKKK